MVIYRLPDIIAGIRDYRVLTFIAVLISFIDASSKIITSGGSLIHKPLQGYTILVNNSKELTFSSEILLNQANRKLLISKLCQPESLALKFLLLVGDISTRHAKSMYVQTNKPFNVISITNGYIVSFTTVTVREYTLLGNSDDPYFCLNCEYRLPPLSDSFF